MTFVLGLVAEPMPLAYLNRPDVDRQAEIKGRQVLDKYNCAGCHVIRPGLFELKPSEETQARLIERYKPDAQDFVARDHSAWTPRPAGAGDRDEGFRHALAGGQTALQWPRPRRGRAAAGGALDGGFARAGAGWDVGGHSGRR